MGKGAAAPGRSGPGPLGRGSAEAFSGKTRLRPDVPIARAVRGRRSGVQVGTPAFLGNGWQGVVGKFFRPHRFLGGQERDPGRQPSVAGGEHAAPCDRLRGHASLPRAPADPGLRFADAQSGGLQPGKPSLRRGPQLLDAEVPELRRPSGKPRHGGRTDGLDHRAAVFRSHPAAGEHPANRQPGGPRRGQPVHVLLRLGEICPGRISVHQ